MNRYRNWFLLFGSAVVLAALYFTDPDRGLSTGLLLLGMVTPIVAVAFAHFARKALHDYPEADARKLFHRAMQSPVGAGLALVALAIVTSALLGLFGRAAHAQDVRTVVPLRAYAQISTLHAELVQHWPDHPLPGYFGALIEHESCVSLTHSRCWSITSSLKTAREEGAGLGQITRAYRADGVQRFDALAELRERHPALREWSWSNVYSRADLQLRAVILMSRDNWQALRLVEDPLQRLAMADAAYNGGLGGVHKERRACAIVSDCDPQQWWGHVELRCLKSRAVIYAGRSACDINRHHVVDVLRVRAPKYRGLV